MNRWKAIDLAIGVAMSDRRRREAVAIPVRFDPSVPEGYVRFERRAQFRMELRSRLAAGEIRAFPELTPLARAVYEGKL